MNILAFALSPLLLGLISADIRHVIQTPYQQQQFVDIYPNTCSDSSYGCINPEFCTKGSVSPLYKHKLVPNVVRLCLLDRP